MLGGDTLSILEIFVVLVAAATVVAIVARRLTILPYSIGLVGPGPGGLGLQPPLDLEIAPDVLLAVLIPGLIFEAAYRIDLRDLDAEPAGDHGSRDGRRPGDGRRRWRWR